jgi:hypothetical protein
MYWRERALLAQVLIGKLPDEVDGYKGPDVVSKVPIVSSGNQPIPSGTQP